MDKNGYIDYVEFVAVMLESSSVAQRDDILQKCFAIFDEDKDGLISEQDLINVSDQKGLQNDTADIHRMILEHDSNGDGKIDFQELAGDGQEVH
ncbi:MAG: calcium-binding CML27 [Trebouxia sp. A1-2]|nr:MAG: calcium-binding CML27 [Trebouxia sp. A1-2]